MSCQVDRLWLMLDAAVQMEQDAVNRNVQFGMDPRRCPLEFHHDAKELLTTAYCPTHNRKLHLFVVANTEMRIGTAR